VSSGFNKTSELLIHDGNWFSFWSVEFEGPGGERMERYVFRHPGAVAVVPIVDKNVVMVRQFRAAIGEEILEIPAGKLDVLGEKLEVAARRELIEETGLSASNVFELTRFYNSAGFTDELTVIYLATDLVAVEAMPDGLEESYMSVEHIPLDRILKLIDDGSIVDAKSIIGLLAAQRHLDF
tara:strand:+ start:552 stop:1094 length:543 start_codon:yes stop_codon:yes gene_type:complete